MRIIQPKRQACYFHRPFQGSTVGSALYASLPGQTQVIYRNRRITKGQIVALGASFPLGGTHVQKTAALAFATSPSFPSLAVPASWQNQTVTLDVRTHECDCENEELGGGRQFSFDGSGAITQKILGSARLTGSIKGDAGSWTFQFVYLASSDGLQPTAYSLIRTAGPTTPPTVTVPASGKRILAISVAALQDGGNYTFKIQARNGSVTADLLTGLAITADALGPSDLTSLTASEH